ncbi:MAG: aspartate--tRNA(Asn) ligase [Theionarchaea archaeon]|nr:MAG: aspartate--tRNA(Asp/Asn) ligase [Theionarchaea archaeon DG-70-1]MBU7030535.1 aspartate--tRNA(Asn) ligase [Theionarchaea archaeon]
MRILTDELGERIGQEVTVAGWVHELRDLGGIKFLLLRDRNGLVQITFLKKKVDADVFQKFSELGREYVIQVKGLVNKSDIAQMGIEIFPAEVTVLSEADSPLPLDPTQKVKADFDTRLNHRVLDLRSRSHQLTFCVQACLVSGFREFLDKEGFYEVHTPKIVATGTEGGTELFPVQYFENKAFLAQSPQFYKQMLVGAGFERVYEIGPVYRAEEHNTVRHINEYTSLDLEFGFITDDTDVRVLENRLLLYMYQKLERECSPVLDELRADLPEVPDTIPAITFEEALEITGEEGYDLSPNGEKRVCDYSAESLNSEFIFITAYPQDKRPMYAMPDGELTKTFDLLLRGIEVTTGGQRIHQYHLLVEKIRERGLNPEDFTFYLEVFKYGMPPHGGFAIGAERLTMQTLNLPNIREATFFPRDRTRIAP